LHGGYSERGKRPPSWEKMGYSKKGKLKEKKGRSSKGEGAQ